MRTTVNLDDELLAKARIGVVLIDASVWIHHLRVGAHGDGNIDGAGWEPSEKPQEETISLPGRSPVTGS